jgi:hypothetical protein
LKPQNISVHVIAAGTAKRDAGRSARMMMKTRRRLVLWLFAYLAASYASAISVLLIMMVAYPDRPDWSHGLLGVTIAPLVFPGIVVFAVWGGFSGNISLINIGFLAIVALLTRLIYAKLSKREQKEITAEHPPAS